MNLFAKLGAGVAVAGVVLTLTTYKDIKRYLQIRQM